MAYISATASEAPQMVDVGLTHVALPVTELDASIAFYAGYAGMQVVHRREGVVWLSDRTRPFVIVLLEAERVAQPLAPFAHLGVSCASRSTVDRLCERARREGRLIGGPTDSGPPVGYWAFIRDPDGHTLELSFGQEVGATVEASEQRAEAERSSSS
jgi:catechol 2,3-dioxygenase-like lactoylglutathione lyase family enzyme